MATLYSKILSLLEENDVQNAPDITGQLCGLLVEEQRLAAPMKTKEPSETKANKDVKVKSETVKKERKKVENKKKSAWMFFVSNSKELRDEYKEEHKGEAGLPTNSMQVCKLIWDSEGFDKSPYERMAATQ
jgi:hypothetical protein